MIMLIQNSLKLAALLSFVVAMPQLAYALPKQGIGKCTCMCIAPSGVNGGSLVSINTYNSQGYSCGAFEGKTCNLDNPYTGGVSTGSLIGCGSATKNFGRPSILVSPWVGVEKLQRR
jgi:hypothetical protein